MLGLFQTLSHLVLGQKGGANRVLIVELPRERPYSVNQLAENLQLNCRTIKHHIDVLCENGLLTTSSSPGYGEAHFLSPELERNYEIFRDIAHRLRNQASHYTFFQKVVEQTHDAVMIVDGQGRVVQSWSRRPLMGFAPNLQLICRGF